MTSELTESCPNANSYLVTHSCSESVCVCVFARQLTYATAIKTSTATLGLFTVGGTWLTGLAPGGVTQFSAFWPKPHAKTNCGSGTFQVLQNNRKFCIKMLKRLSWRSILKHELNSKSCCNSNLWDAGHVGTCRQQWLKRSLFSWNIRLAFRASSKSTMWESERLSTTLYLV